MPSQISPIDILQTLVRQPSLSGQEGGVIAAAERAMQLVGFDRVWRDSCGNLVSELHGSRPGGKMIFDAHLDVVPVVNSDQWGRNPFSGDLAEGRVWGRGSTDNKGSMAAMIAGLGSLGRTEYAGTVYVVGSVGEETFEGIGLQQVVDAIHPQVVVVGEPTNCRLGFGQRGRARVTFRVRGKAAHSSADDQTGNAVYALAKLAAQLSDHTFPTHTALGKGSHAPIEVISDPFPSLSTVPVECRLTLDRRLMPVETEKIVLQDYEALLAELQGASVEMDRVTYTSYTGKSFTQNDFHPAWDTGAESDLVHQCQDALKQAGILAELYAVPYCTNASYSAGVAGIPAVVFGPGDIAQAHTSDEFIEVMEVEKAAKGYEALAKSLSTYYQN
jgi:putative selenium metabolism hydrolase